MKHSRGILFAALSVAALAPATALATATGVVWDLGPGGVRYVALGDSQTAGGPFLMNPRFDPFGCARSDHNFPTIVAKRLHVRAFRDVSCSTASTENFYVAQENPNGIPGSNPPQLDAVTRDTTLVTIGPIGGNDIPMLNVAANCFATAAMPPGTGLSCSERYAASSPDPNHEAIEALHPKLARILRDVHARAPRAKVIVVGYGREFPPGGCWPTIPMWPGDADYFQDLSDRMNAVLAQEAARNHATFAKLDPTRAIHHTMCAGRGQQWISFLPLSGPAFPLHPTRRGMAAFGRIVSAVVRSGARWSP